MNDMDYRGFEIIEAEQPIWDNSSDLGDQTRKSAGKLLSRNGHGPQHGLRSLIDSSAVPNEKLPMLDVVYDRLVRSLSTSMRNFTSDNIEVSIVRLTSMRFGDFLHSLPEPVLIGVAHAEEWDNYGLVSVESPLIYSIVDALLGGRRGTTPSGTEARAFTTIETGLVAKMMQIIIDELQQAFAPLSKIGFSLDRVEANPRFASIARPTNVVSVATLHVAMEGRGGRFRIVLPYATLEPIRELLLQRFMGERLGRDGMWEAHLASELRRTKLQIDALLDEQTIPLGTVMDFQVGQTLPLGVSTDSPIELRCGDVRLARGTIGRSGQKVAVQITETREQMGQK